MASNLLQLRRAAGYRSAREYCEHSGIPQPTYTRYESNPAKIPIAAAWAIADDLRCTIDEVVGRDIGEAYERPCPMQAAYERLTPRGRDSVDRFIRFVLEEEADERRSREAGEERLYEQLAAQYEAQLMREVMARVPLGELPPATTAAERRDRFEQYVADIAAEKRKQQGEGGCEAAVERDERTRARLMVAYARMHEDELRKEGALTEDEPGAAQDA